MKLTAWFGPTINPVRCGVFQRRHKTLHFMVFSFFDGNQWFVGADTPDIAEKETMLSVNQHNFLWRGVLK